MEKLIASSFRLPKTLTNLDSKTNSVLTNLKILVGDNAANPNLTDAKIKALRVLLDQLKANFGETLRQENCSEFIKTVNIGTDHECMELTVQQHWIGLDLCTMFRNGMNFAHISLPLHQIVALASQRLASTEPATNLGMSNALGFEHGEKYEPTRPKHLDNSSNHSNRLDSIKADMYLPHENEFSDNVASGKKSGRGPNESKPLAKRWQFHDDPRPDSYKKRGSFLTQSIRSASQLEKPDAKTELRKVLEEKQKNKQPGKELMSMKK